MKRQVIDLDLINKAKSGYQGAYSALFEYYYQYLFNYTRIYVLNDTDAEDLTMITFEKAFKDLNKYAPFFTFKTWLSKIARNTCIDFLRSKKYNPSNNGIDITELSYIKTIENPEQMIIHEENIKQLKILVNGLSSRRREIIIRRSMGMKCREISDEMDISISAVTGQLRYIKLKLAI